MPRTETLLFCAGNNWDGVASTDRALALALSTQISVLWVDPPDAFSQWRKDRRRHEFTPLRLDEPHPSVRRLRISGPPGLTRPFMRDATDYFYRRAVQRTIADLSLEVTSTVLANPIHRFPRAPGRRMFYVTDDWIAGAELMGFDRAYVKRMMRANTRSSDILAAVSPQLVRLLTEDPLGSAARTLLLPNGCDPERFTDDAARPGDVPAGPYALLMGQLNERLDIDVLSALAAAQIPLVVVGPRTERSPSTVTAFDRLFAQQTVRHVGSRSQHELAGYLRWAAVGLTPYADSAFNRASSPLKTLDYLSAGLSVVSTDMPAARAMNTEWVTITQTPASFTQAVQHALASEPGAYQRVACRSIARDNSWAARAAQLLRSIQPGALNRSGQNPSLRDPV